LVKKVLRCDCSFEARAADEDGLVSEVQRHAREALLPGASAAAGALAVVVVAFALLAAQAGGARGTPASVHVSLQPGLVTLGGRATVRVDGWNGARLQVALAGATNRNGRPLGWRDARRRGRTWLADLPHPTLRGIYPVLLRHNPGDRITRSPNWLLRVFRPHANHEPRFAAPQDAVRWWVHTRPHGIIRALRPWRRPDFDKRDPRLHRLYVVAYNPPGRPGIDNRLGTFITTVRDGYNGPWRLLEATVLP
jgi:hypothetical protein